MPFDHPSLRWKIRISYSEEERKISQAALFPTFDQLEAFYNDLKVMNKKKQFTLLEVFKKYTALAQLEGIYFIQDNEGFSHVHNYNSPCLTTRRT